MTQGRVSPAAVARRSAQMAWLVAAAVGVLVGEASAGVQEAVEAVIRGSVLKDAKVGWSVREGNGEWSAGRRSSQGRVPASNMKLVTTAAALLTLGPDFVFRTELRVDGKSLIIRGDGDPAFGDPRLLKKLEMDPDDLLDRWVGVVKKEGIERVERLLVDDRVFDRQFVHPSWPKDQLHRWYCAPVGGINFNDNCLDVYAEPRSSGRPPRVWTSPSDPAVELTNRAVSGDDNAFWATRKEGTNRIELRGEVDRRLESPVHVTIHDPPMFFAETFRKRLAKQGVDVGDVRRVAADAPRSPGRLLAVVRSPLPTVVTRCNRHSQNLFAEALLKRMGHEMTGEAGSWSNGATAVKKAVGELLGAVPGTLEVADGSGLSRNNRVSPLTVTRLLTAMRSRSKTHTLFRRSLATPGEGTLQRRLTRAGLRATLRAKTGSLNGVRCLSGYLFTERKSVAFSVMVNELRGAPSKANEAIDRIVQAIDRHRFAPSTRAGG